MLLYGHIYCCHKLWNWRVSLLKYQQSEKFYNRTFRGNNVDEYVPPDGFIN